MVLFLPLLCKVDIYSVENVFGHLLNVTLYSLGESEIINNST